MSHDYEIFWKDKASHDFEYGACRAKNLAEEIIVGWTDQTDLHGFEHILTTHALEHFGEMIDGGFAETRHNAFATCKVCSLSRSLRPARRMNV